MKTTILAAAVLGAASALSAGAQTLQPPPYTPWYVGAAVGSIKTDKGIVADRETTIRDSGLATNISSSFDDKDTSGKFWLGYKLTPYLAVEAHYTDFGTNNIDTRFNVPQGSSGVGSAHTERDVNGWGLDLVGTYPVWDRLSVYGKLGWLRSDVKTRVHLFGDARFGDNAGGDFRSERSRENNVKYGLGLRYDITREWSANLEWEHVNDIGKRATLTSDNPTLEADVDAFWLGATYRF